LSVKIKKVYQNIKLLDYLDNVFYFMKIII